MIKRSRPKPEGSVTAKSPSVAIIGGGIAGMSAAFFLARSGIETTIYEAADTLGGACSSISLDGRTVDAFYHVLTLNGPLREIADAIDLRPLLRRVATTTGYFVGGVLHPLTSIREIASFKALTVGQRIMLAVCVLRALATRDGNSLDDVRAEDWLCRIGGQGAYERFWLPMMRAKFGTQLRRIVATDMWFRIRRFAETAFLAKGGGCYTPRGSLAVFIDRLADALAGMGATIVTGAPVQAIAPRDGGGFQLALPNGREAVHDIVISTLPLPLFARIVPGGHDDYRLRLSAIEYLNNACLILKTTRPISENYQLAFADDDVPFTAIIGAHHLYPADEQGGFITYFSRYCAADDAAITMTADELLASYLPYISKIRPDFACDEVLAKYHSRGIAIEPLHTIGYGRRIPGFRTPWPGLWCLSAANIYPEPTVIDTSAHYAKRLVDEVLRSEQGTRA